MLLLNPYCGVYSPDSAGSNTAFTPVCKVVIQAYVLGTPGTSQCPEGTISVDTSECAFGGEILASQADFKPKHALQVDGRPHVPAGCTVYANDWSAHWNTNTG